MGRGRVVRACERGVFPERRFVAGFFRRLLAYLTPHISHTYPFNTYPTNTYPTNTYPFNTYPTNTYPFNTYPFNAHPFKRYARILSIRIVSIRIHAMRIHSMRIHSKGLHQQEWQCMWMQNISLHIIASGGMAMYVNAKHILAYHCISRNGNEYEYHCMSFHTIATRREWQWK